VPQFGHGVPEPGDRAGVVGSGGGTGWLVGGAPTDGALIGGVLSTIVPPIFAPQWSQKSSVDEAWPFGQG
jgi:hypothetical protein